MSDSLIEQVKRLAEAQKTGALFDKVSRLSGGKFIAERLSFDFPALLAYIAALTEKLRAVEAERDEAQAEVHRLANGEGCNQCNDHIISLDEDLSALRADLERKDAALKVIAESDEWSGGLSNTSHQERARAALQPKEPPCQKA